MILKFPRKYLLPALAAALAFVMTGCISPKVKEARAYLPVLENAGLGQLKDEVNRFAGVSSMRGKIYAGFEDNSFADIGLAEKYRTADGEITVQRPANILLKIQVPVIKTDVAQMTSDGTRFRVAILEDGAGGKYRRFLLGTNDADYSKLEESVTSGQSNIGQDKELRKKVNAFSDLRPQHFTEAILMHQVDPEKTYVQSEFYQEEFDSAARKESPTRSILRGYYFLDELRKNEDGTLGMSRRFWFDRVGKIRLARQQIFDSKGYLESDITYGAEARFGESGQYTLPARFEVTRPKERYKMSLTFSSPESTVIDKSYPATAFILENRWSLPVVDLDNEMRKRSASKTPGGNLF
jgi:hypothetical protein